MCTKVEFSCLFTLPDGDPYEAASNPSMDVIISKIRQADCQVERINPRLPVGGLGGQVDWLALFMENIDTLLAVGHIVLDVVKDHFISQPHAQCKIALRTKQFEIKICCDSRSAKIVIPAIFGQLAHLQEISHASN